MLIDPSSTATALPGALTHRACIAASEPGAQSARLRVQVRRYARGGPYVLCGQLIELDSSRGEWFKIDTDADGPVWAEGRNVRLCSGDDRCTCEGPQPRQRGAKGGPC